MQCEMISTKYFHKITHCRARKRAHETEGGIMAARSIPTVGGRRFNLCCLQPIIACFGDTSRHQHLWKIFGYADLRGGWSPPTISMTGDVVNKPNGRLYKECRCWAKGFHHLPIFCGVVYGSDGGLRGTFAPSYSRIIISPVVHGDEGDDAALPGQRGRLYCRYADALLLN